MRGLLVTLPPASLLPQAPQPAYLEPAGMVRRQTACPALLRTQVLRQAQDLDADEGVLLDLHQHPLTAPTRPPPGSMTGAGERANGSRLNDPAVADDQRSRAIWDRPRDLAPDVGLGLGER